MRHWHCPFRVRCLQHRNEKAHSKLSSDSLGSHDAGCVHADKDSGASTMLAVAHCSTRSVAFGLSIAVPAECGVRSGQLALLCAQSGGQRIWAPCLPGFWFPVCLRHPLTASPQHSLRLSAKLMMLQYVFCGKSSAPQEAWQRQDQACCCRSTFVQVYSELCCVTKYEHPLSCFPQLPHSAWQNESVAGNARMQPTSQLRYQTT